MNGRAFSQRIFILWIIFLALIVFVVILLGLLRLYQFQGLQAEPAIEAVPATTPEATNTIEVKPRVSQLSPTFTPIPIVTPESPTGVVPVEGLIAYYPFNGNANDESGNGNNGTVNGAILTTDRFGNMNKAYSFDGTNDYISIQSDPTLDLLNIGTVCTWFQFKEKAGDRNRTIIGKYRSDTKDEDGYIIIANQYMENNNIRAWIKDTNTNTSDPFGQSTIFNPTLNWKFVCLTVNNKQAKGYLDGVSIGVGEIINDYNPLGNSLQLLIGAGYHKSFSIYNYFHGSIDDIRLYNRALADEEIELLYHEGGWEE